MVIQLSNTTTTTNTEARCSFLIGFTFAGSRVAVERTIGKTNFPVVGAFCVRFHCARF